MNGWKIVRPDGSTHDGYRWPLVVKGIQAPVVVEATDIDRTHKRECPSKPGDGLCLAKTFRGACSGGISLASCVGLRVTYQKGDVLGEDDDKLRVAKVTVVDVFDVLAEIRAGKHADLRDADLGGADLGGAYLRGADLRGADLRDADLRDAYLRYAYGTPLGAVPSGWWLDAAGRWERAS